MIAVTGVVILITWRVPQKITRSLSVQATEISHWGYNYNKKTCWVILMLWPMLLFQSLLLIIKKRLSKDIPIFWHREREIDKNPWTYIITQVILFWGYPPLHSPGMHSELCFIVMPVSHVQWRVFELHTAWGIFSQANDDSPSHWLPSIAATKMY